MQNITYSMVWASLAASAFLGAFTLVQAITDRQRRLQFGAFSLLCWITAAIDFLRPQLGPPLYEESRVVFWSLYGAAVMWLNSAPLSLVVPCGAVPCCLGVTIWLLGYRELATSFTIPTSFAIAAISHARTYVQREGYSSGVLAAYTTAMAVSCSSYHEAVSTGDVRILTLGYCHWVLLNVITVIFGWVQLPREMRGRAPVTLSRGHAHLFFGTVVFSEMAVLWGLLGAFTWPPMVYLAGNVSLLLATAILHFHYRHQLVIYTDNVTVLLEERTATLRQAQKELSQQNEIQAQQLEEQERELKAKTAVIERQRRLELAAQTAAQAAHDIQNLLSPILGQIARLDRTDQDPADLSRTAALMRKQLQDLLALNGQLLALSRRGRMDLHPVSLRELLHDLAERFATENLEVLVEQDPWIQGASSQLGRALSNLILNALEVQPRGGKKVLLRGGIIDIQEIRRCHLGFLSPGRYAFVCVEDSGPGISEEYRGKLLEPFFSLKKRGQGSGSGLGLSVVTAVVDDHRGVLDLKTDSDGTTFTLYFPITPPPSDWQSDEALCGNETVLVTDDDSATLEWCSRILEDSGYRVIIARDGTDAIRVVQFEHVDILLLDLKMPQMGGYDAFFGALHVRPGVKAIVHSSYVSAEESVRLRQIGVSSLLQKPASKREILLALRLALDENRPQKKTPR